MEIKKISEMRSNDGISVLMYASPGTGKTYSLQYLSGKTLIIDIDRGSKCLDCKSNKNIDNIDILQIELSDLNNIISKLEQEKINYDNIVIDNITELDKLMLTSLGRNGKNGGAPEMQHYNQVIFKTADYCRRFRNLTAKGVNIIFTAWETMGERVYPSGEKVSITKPMLSGKSSVETIIGLCDIVARLEISTKDEETRFFRMKGSNTCYARDRIYNRDFCAVDKLLVDETSNEPSDA